MMRLCLLCLAFLLLTGRGFALEVRQSIWGFDGKVTPGRLAPLSILISNPGLKPFDGSLSVEESAGLGQRAGAAVVQPLYLAPNTERWVQFQVFIGTYADDFILSWAAGVRDRETIKRPNSGPPARVLLSDAANPFAASGGFKVLPDVLFPTTVSATDGLDAVVLDYVPRWEPLRREAFMDWLKRGGLVLVLHGPNGEYPTFEEQLAPLNISGDQATVGAGYVLRAPVGRRDAGEALLADRRFPLPTFRDNSSPAVHDLETSVFQRLSKITRPNLNWDLITFVSIIYLALIGPIHFFAGRKLDYRINLAIFVGSVLVFGYIFSVVGRRGYAETQTVHSLAIAREIDDGRYDVTQWSSAFATNGAIYRLTHEAPANLYAAVSRERVAGEILNGRDGAFLADIPLYSSREFFHRAVMPGPKLGVTVAEWKPENSLASLVLNCGPDFPPETQEIAAYYKDSLVTLKRHGSQLKPDGLVRSYKDRLNRDAVNRATYTYDYEYRRDVQSEEERAALQARMINETLPLLYVRALEGKEHFAKDIAPTRPDRLQLFVAAPAPPSFALKTAGFAHERGLVLYVQEISKP